MEIAFLSPEAIVPANTGGRIVVFNKIKYLSELGHKIHVFCIVDRQEEINNQIVELSDICVSVKCYNRNVTKVNSLIKSLVVPFAVASRTSNKLMADLDNLLATKPINIIMIEMPQMADNVVHIANKYNVKVVLCQQNIEAKAMRSVAETITNPIKKIIYVIDSKRMNMYEKNIYRKGLVDLYTFVSDADMDSFNQDYNFKNIPTIRLPIGAEEHSLQKHQTRFKNVIIVGKMSYLPNVEGVLWFYHKVWPIVKKEIGDPHLFIVGKDPSLSIKSIKDSTVTVTGTVESVENYYRDAAVAAIPIFNGGGVKTKLIEASSYGVPIVCTISGAIGTCFKNGYHAVITNDEIEFANGIIAALKRDERSKILAKNALDTFYREYTWSSIISQFEKDLLRLLA